MAYAATLSCVLGGSGARAAPAAVAGFSYVKSFAGIDEYTEDANGLQVLIKPDHSAPVVTFQVTYRVGSRNEVTGTTGATHLLEHLMFKGSEHFNDPAGNSIKQYLEATGGGFNANTSFDRTTYFAIWKAMSRSRRTGCAISGCARRTDRPR
jgi:zinc protease